MKDNNLKKPKIVAAGILMAAAATGGTYLASSQGASAEEVPSTNTANSTTEATETSGSQHTHQRKSGHPGKPKNLTAEEWEQKKAEIKAKIQEKFANMTEEEKAEWRATHKKRSRSTESADASASTDSTSATE